MTDNMKYMSLTRSDWQKHQNTYRSKTLDSQIPGCRWHRVVLREVYIPEGSAMTVSFATSEKETGNIHEIRWCGETTFNHGDITETVIKSPPGRYLYLKIEFDNIAESSAFVPGEVKVYYPRLSFLHYLPETYRDQPGTNFPDRFIALFETFLYDMEEKISGIHHYFDPTTAPPDFIPWLAQWVSLDLYELLGEKNREFILKAVEFYKKKGTVDGIAQLVQFLTGKTCCVKEYMNNVFRTYGMEHVRDQDDNPPGNRNECKKFYHKTSMTVDTANRSLLNNMGTYEDEVHYVTDSSQNGYYNRNVIGLFIFIYSAGKKFEIHEKIHHIIKTFLPVFVRAEIIVVDKVDYTASYPLKWVREEHKSHIHDREAEKIAPPMGIYKDNTNWQWFYTNNNNKGTTNQLQFRVPHSRMGVDIPI